MRSRSTMHIQPLPRQKLSKNLGDLDKPLLVEATEGTDGGPIALHHTIDLGLHRGTDESFLS